MKPLYMILAFLFLALGAVGVVLPVLPTVPFLLLASFCFARGSARYHRWFVGTKLYQRHLKEYTQSRSMPLGTKLGILLPVTGMLVLVMLLVDSTVMRIVLSLLLAVKYTYFIFRIKTIPRRGAQEAPEQTTGGHNHGNKRMV